MVWIRMRNHQGREKEPELSTGHRTGRLDGWMGTWEEVLRVVGATG